MGNGSSAPKISAQDKAVLDLKNQRDKLHQYQRRLQPLVSQYHTIALHHLKANDKERALLALRRKKYHESLVLKTDKQLAQLEILTSDVEFALVQKDVLFGLQRGTEVLKEIHKEMGGLDAVEKLVGESEEERAFQQEVSEMLTGRITLEEEDEIEEELALLEDKARVAESRQKTTKLPEAPNGPIIREHDLPSVTAEPALNGVEPRTRQQIAAE